MARGSDKTGATFSASLLETEHDDPSPEARLDRWRTAVKDS